MNYRWSIFGLFSLFIAVVLWIANTGRGDKYWELLRHIPHGDKIGHIVLMGMLCLLLNHALNLRRVSIRGRGVLLGSIAVSLFVVVEESSQFFLATRDCDPADLAANFVGIWLAGRIAPRLARHSSLARESR